MIDDLNKQLNDVSKEMATRGYAFVWGSVAIDDDTTTLVGGNGDIDSIGMRANCQLVSDMLNTVYELASSMRPRK